MADEDPSLRSGYPEGETDFPRLGVSRAPRGIFKGAES